MTWSELSLETTSWKRMWGLKRRQETRLLQYSGEEPVRVLLTELYSHANPVRLSSYALVWEVKGIYFRFNMLKSHGLEPKAFPQSSRIVRLRKWLDEKIEGSKKRLRFQAWVIRYILSEIRKITWRTITRLILDMLYWKVLVGCPNNHIFSLSIWPLIFTLSIQNLWYSSLPSAFLLAFSSSDGLIPSLVCILLSPAQSLNMSHHSWQQFWLLGGCVPLTPNWALYLVVH